MKIEKISLEEIYDVAILRHGFKPHLRDYEFILETNWNDDLAGRYSLTLKHCYELDYKTIVADDTIVKSWDDIFLDYEKWERNVELDGFVWGVNWTMAYPGFEIIKKSEKAKKWTKRLGKEMKMVNLETNTFVLNLIFHDFELEKIGDDTSLIDKVSIPIDSK